MGINIKRIFIACSCKSALCSYAFFPGDYYFIAGSYFLPRNNGEKSAIDTTGRYEGR